MKNMKTKIHYRVGTVASGKTFSLMKQVSGQNNLFIEALKYQKVFRDRMMKNSTHYYDSNIDLSKSKVVTVKDYLLDGASGYENIIIEDFNDFISHLFPNKNVFININQAQPNVEYEVLESTFNTNRFREFMNEKGFE